MLHEVRARHAAVMLSLVIYIEKVLPKDVREALNRTPYTSRRLHCEVRGVHEQCVTAALSTRAQGYRPGRGTHMGKKVPEIVGNEAHCRSVDLRKRRYNRYTDTKATLLRNPRDTDKVDGARRRVESIK